MWKYRQKAQGHPEGGGNRRRGDKGLGGDLSTMDAYTVAVLIVMMLPRVFTDVNT